MRLVDRIFINPKFVAPAASIGGKLLKILIATLAVFRFSPPRPSKDGAFLTEMALMQEASALVLVSAETVRNGWRRLLGVRFWP
jgi:hypothetical protein